MTVNRFSWRLDPRVSPAPGGLNGFTEARGLAGRLPPVHKELGQADGPWRRKAFGEQRGKRDVKELAEAGAVQLVQDG